MAARDFEPGLGRLRPAERRPYRLVARGSGRGLMAKNNITDIWEQVKWIILEIKKNVKSRLESLYQLGNSY